MGSATRDEINEFLFKFKFFAQPPGGFVFAERRKNLYSMAEIGITQADALNIIFELTYLNYTEKDRDFFGRQVWKFGFTLDNCEIYIKLADDFSNSISKCISFHIADFKIKYPYRRSEK